MSGGEEGGGEPSSGNAPDKSDGNTFRCYSPVFYSVTESLSEIVFVPVERTEVYRALRKKQVICVNPRAPSGQAASANGANCLFSRAISTHGFWFDQCGKHVDCPKQVSGH